MLLNIHVHDTLLSSLLLDLREQCSFFHIMMRVEDLMPTFGICNEVFCVLGADIRRLLVNAV
jgi:hypothetical protein